LAVGRDLSAAALEVLSWVAYRGAATRREIEKARGQDSAALLSRLHVQGYLAGVTEDEAPGRPYQYRLTTRAIATFGYSSVEEMQTTLATVAAGASQA
jgi:chromosome segregation and condensation protein ScpB